MGLASLIISAAAFIWAGITFFVHDNKIKKQEKRLNEYQLKKIEQEEFESKRAIIEGNAYEDVKGRIIIKVFNRGEAIARNVNVIIPDSNGYQVVKNPCPIDLKPKHSFEILLISFESSSKKIEVSFEWSDEISESNKDNQQIPI